MGVFTPGLKVKGTIDFSEIVIFKFRFKILPFNLHSVL